MELELHAGNSVSSRLETSQLCHRSHRKQPDTEYLYSSWELGQQDGDGVYRPRLERERVIDASADVLFAELRFAWLAWVEISLWTTPGFLVGHELVCASSLPIFPASNHPSMSTASIWWSAVQRRMLNQISQSARSLCLCGR